MVVATRMLVTMLTRSGLPWSITSPALSLQTVYRTRSSCSCSVCAATVSSCETKRLLGGKATLSMTRGAETTEGSLPPNFGAA